MSLVSRLSVYTGKQSGGMARYRSERSPHLGQLWAIASYFLHTMQSLVFNELHKQALGYN